MITSWRELLQKVVVETEECFDDLIITLTDEQMDTKFDNCVGAHREGHDFTAWGKKYVYFPTEYKEVETIGWVLRNPPEGDK